MLRKTDLSNNLHLAHNPGTRDQGISSPHPQITHYSKAYFVSNHFSYILFHAFGGHELCILDSGNNFGRHNLDHFD